MKLYIDLRQSRLTRLIPALSLLIVVFAAVVSPAVAQTGGQICLSAFEDVNGNQLKDQGEAPITQDIVVTLADAQGIIVQSLLLDDSPLSSNGVVCFQSLPAGQYTLTASSANYDATTNTSFLTAVDATGNVQRFDYGGKLAISRSTAQPSNTGVMTPQRQSALIERILFSSIGALIAVAVLGFLGILVYWFGFRLPPKSRVASYGRATGQYPAVGYAPPAPGQYTPAPAMRPVDPSTGQVRGVAPVPPVADVPNSFDDTGPVRTVKPADVPPPAPLDVPPASDDDTGRYRPPRE